MSAPPISSTSPPRWFFGLLQHRTCVLPTYRGWLALLAAAALGVVVALRGVYGFLAVQDPVPGGVLVLEGWVPDYILTRAAAEYQSGHYTVWCVTGEPLEKGAPLSDYRDNAALTVATFVRLGGDASQLQPVPWETVRRDRTYASALALKAWLKDHGAAADKICIVTEGAHARRSRLLYQKAFGSASRLGVIAVPDRKFDPEHWWNSSQGFRTVVGEAVAYVYARLLFRGQ